MNIDDFQYHNYPSSTFRRHNIHTWEDQGVTKEGWTKYFWDREESYTYNYLPWLKYKRIDKIYPEKIKEVQEENKADVEEKDHQLPRRKPEESKPAVNQRKKRNWAIDTDSRYRITNNPQPQSPTRTTQFFQSVNDINRNLRCDFQKNTLWKPIHRLKNGAGANNLSTSTSCNFKDHYKDQFSKLRNNVTCFEKGFFSPQHYTKKQMNMGFTLTTIPNIPKKMERRKNSPFAWFQKRWNDSTRWENVEKDNRNLFNCFKVLDEQTGRLPGIESLLNKQGSRNVYFRSQGKFMGERYDPHNYETYSIEKKK